MAAKILGIRPMIANFADLNKIQNMVNVAPITNSNVEVCDENSFFNIPLNNTVIPVTCTSLASMFKFSTAKFLISLISSSREKISPVS